MTEIKIPNKDTKGRILYDYLIEHGGTLTRQQIIDIVPGATECNICSRLNYPQFKSSWMGWLERIDRNCYGLRKQPFVDNDKFHAGYYGGSGGKVIKTF